MESVRGCACPSRRESCGNAHAHALTCTPRVGYTCTHAWVHTLHSHLHSHVHTVTLTSARLLVARLAEVAVGRVGRVAIHGVRDARVRRQASEPQVSVTHPPTSPYPAHRLRYSPAAAYHPLPPDSIRRAFAARSRLVLCAEGSCGLQGAGAAYGGAGSGCGFRVRVRVWLIGCGLGCLQVRARLWRGIWVCAGPRTSRPLSAIEKRMWSALSGSASTKWTRQPRDAK
eukprot:5904747-Prymnesium_polylepis.1